jgi:GNAT superfamily N-acetyltransferase
MIYILIETNSQSRLSYCIDIKEKTLILLYLYVAPEFRGSGVGTRMISELTHRNRQNEYVKLDDMSDFQRDRDHNIYLKCGFRYENEFGPEMIGKTDMISRHCRSLLRKRNFKKRSVNFIIVLE